MPLYYYTARTQEGRLVSATLGFRDELSLRRYLRSNNLHVLEIEQKHAKRFRWSRNVQLGDLVIMIRHLRTMILAEMPLVTGLEALADQSTNAKLAEALKEIVRGVSSGRSLAACLGEHSRLFPEMLVTLVEAGEESGRLPETLAEAARQMDLQIEIRQRLLSAMLYPVFTLVATVATVVAMLMFIVPVFQDIYNELHAPLPALTLLLISLSNLVIHFWWVAVLLLGVLTWLLRRYYETPDGRRNIDAFKLKIPLFGVLVHKSAIANLTGSLAGLLESGVPLLHALETASRTAGNEVIAESIRSAVGDITMGRRLSDHMERSGHFPIMVYRMIAIAEQIGTLPMVLRQICASYSEEVTYALRRAVILLEPMLVLTVGAIVGFVLVALYYPIFKLADVFLKSG